MGASRWWPTALTTPNNGQKTPAELGYGTQSLTVFVPDVDAHYEKAKSAGAMIVEDLHETPYGERQYGARDLDGHHGSSPPMPATSAPPNGARQ